jgi:hypothetical protein
MSLPFVSFIKPEEGVYSIGTGTLKHTSLASGLYGGKWGGTPIAAEAASEVVPHIGLTSIVGQVAAITYETMPEWVRNKIAPMMRIDTQARIEISEVLTEFKPGARALSEASIH